MSPAVLGRLCALVVLLGPAQEAWACSPPPGWTPAGAFAEASLVFHALVTKTELSNFEDTKSPEDGRHLVHIEYELREAIKGNPQADGVVTTTNAVLGGCGVPVLTGQEYIFFIDPSSEPLPAAEQASSRSQGMISIIDTQMLQPDPEFRDKALDGVRALAE